MGAGTSWPCADAPLIEVHLLSRSLSLSLSLSVYTVVTCKGGSLYIQ